MGIWVISFLGGLPLFFITCLSVNTFIHFCWVYTEEWNRMGQRVCICIHSTLGDNAKPFSKMAVPIYVPSSSVWEFQLFYTLNLCIFVLFLPIRISTNSACQLLYQSCCDSDYDEHRDQCNTVFYLFLLHITPFI